MYDYSFRLTSDTFSHTPGTCTWDAEIEEYVLVDAFGDAFYGATPRECHDASRVSIHAPREEGWT